MTQLRLIWSDMLCINLKIGWVEWCTAGRAYNILKGLLKHKTFV